MNHIKIFFDKPRHVTLLVKHEKIRMFREFLGELCDLGRSQFSILTEPVIHKNVSNIPKRHIFSRSITTSWSLNWPKMRLFLSIYTVRNEFKFFEISYYGKKLLRIPDFDLTKAFRNDFDFWNSTLNWNMTP